MDVVVFKCSKICPTGNRWNRALFSGQSPASQTVVTAQIAPKICQGQPPAMYSDSECSRFHPKRFTSGGVIAERVNTSKLPHKINPIFGRSLLGFEPNKTEKRKKLTQAKRIQGGPKSDTSRTYVTLYERYHFFWPTRYSPRDRHAARAKSVNNPITMTLVLLLQLQFARRFVYRLARCFSVNETAKQCVLLCTRGVVALTGQSLSTQLGACSIQELRKCLDKRPGRIILKIPIHAQKASR